VYAIWLPMLAGDSRGAWDAHVLDDPRVVSLWDGSRLAGRWFADHSTGGLRAPGDIVWDAYLAFDHLLAAMTDPLLAQPLPPDVRIEQPRRSFEITPPEGAEEVDHDRLEILLADGCHCSSLASYTSDHPRIRKAAQGGARAPPPRRSGASARDGSLVVGAKAESANEL
jgi:hypothetical protein